MYTGTGEGSGAQRDKAAASRGVDSSWGLARDSEHYTHASQQGPGYMALPRVPISLGLHIPQKKGELSYSGCEVGRGMEAAT